MSQVTRPEEKVASLDGLRAFSVLLVVFSHFLESGTAPTWLSPILKLADGALGVRFFFCISGFLITYLMLVEKRRFGFVDIKSFYIRRILRIIPVSYVFVIALIVISLFTTFHFSNCQIFTALSFTKNYACGSWIDGHLWSLSVEEQYYLVWPFFVAYVRTVPLIAIAGAGILLSPLSRALEYSMGHRSFFWLPSHTDALMIGSLAAMMMTHRRDFLVKWAARWTLQIRVLALVCMFAPIVLSRNLLLGWFTVTLGPILQAVGATYLILSFALVKYDFAYRVLNYRPIVIIGVLSFSIYVWQQIFFAHPSVFGINYFALLEWPLNIISIFVVALISYYALERPFMQLRRYYRPQHDRRY